MLVVLLSCPTLAAHSFDLAESASSANLRCYTALQDDEALLLYAVVRGMRLSRILEVGGLDGYSARNFLQAMEPTQGMVYTVGCEYRRGTFSLCSTYGSGRH